MCRIQRLAASIGLSHISVIVDGSFHGRQGAGFGGTLINFNGLMGRVQ
jgi:hypothetical protein